jgi:hypothetical protein
MIAVTTRIALMTEAEARNPRIDHYGICWAIRVPP